MANHTVKKGDAGRLQYYLGKTLALLRVRSAAGGLEVSDQVLRLVIFNGKAWEMAAVRLEPGVLDKGKIKNRESFAASLRELRGKVVRPKEKKRLSVVLALSSAPIYSQSFTLPLMDGEELKKAMALNVQMLSPVDPSQVYAGAQLLERDEEALKINLSAAFIDRSIVDDLANVLLENGFIAVGAESRPLALMRILREKGSGIDIDRSYLLVNIDNVGIEFLVVRKGQLYFEYASQWTDLMDAQGQVPLEKFKDALTSNMRQVVNFYGQHWREPLAAVILSASAFAEAAEQAITSVSSLPVMRLTLLLGQPLSSEWLIALGASIRGWRSSARDDEINLLGEGASDAFAKEQLLHFLSFWRVAVPVAFALLLMTFTLANVFISRTRAAIEAQTVSDLAAARVKEIAGLQASSTEFNALVALTASIESTLHPKYALAQKLFDLAASSSVELNHMTLAEAGTQLVLSGNADSEDGIVGFKTLLEADPQHFTNVDLPITAIQQMGNRFSFSMNLQVVSFVF